MNIVIKSITDIKYTISNDDINYEEQFLKENESIRLKNKYLNILEGDVFISGVIDDGSIELHSNVSLIVSYDNFLLLNKQSSIILNDHSHIGIYNNSIIRVFDDSSIKLHNNSYISITSDGSLDFNYNSSLDMFDNSSLHVYCEGILDINSNNININDNSEIIVTISTIRINNKNIKLTYCEKNDKKFYKLTFEDHLIVNNMLKLNIDTIDKNELPKGIFNRNKSINSLDISLSNLRTSNLIEYL